MCRTKVHGTGENKMTITKESIIGDVLKYDSTTAEYFLAIGMHCLGCPMARSESIEAACKAHNTDADELIAKLNKHLSEKK